jgi:hypothetical protein
MDQFKAVSVWRQHFAKWAQSAEIANFRIRLRVFPMPSEGANHADSCLQPNRGSDAAHAADDVHL